MHQSVSPEHQFARRLWRLLQNRYTLALLVCLFVVNARLFTIKRFGVQEPYMDSFSELVDYKAAVEHDYSALWQHTLKLHNEHRIILTHGTNVALFLLNQEKWDLLVEACLNALLAGLCVAAIFAGIGRHFTGRRFVFFAFLLLIVFGLPISCENILWGFQSQHFYFILFSVIAITCLIGGKAGRAAWWCGVVSGIVACLTLGSGFYALLSVAVTCSIMALRPEYRTRSLAFTAGISVLLLVAYLPWLFGVQTEPQYQAHSILQFGNSLALNLSWPNVASFQVWFFLLVQLPILALGSAIFLRRDPLPKSSYVILGLGIWHLMVMLSLSYLRGSYTPYVRYYDYNAFNVVLNGAALLELSRLQLFPALASAIRTGIFAAWTAAIVLGCCQLFNKAWFETLPQRKGDLIEEQSAIRNLFHTNDLAALTSPELNGVYPFKEEWAQWIASLLQDPELYPCLPNEMKPGLDRSPDNEPMSRLSRLLLRRSDFALGGILVLLAGSFGCSLLASGINRDSTGTFVKTLSP